MINRQRRKKDHHVGQTGALEESNTLLISSKLLADLKNRGILAFKEMSDAEQKVVWNWSREVIRQYRNILESNPSNIRNIESLPFPKEDIKLAIKLSLPFYISKDVQSMVKMLRTAYKELGAFQLIEEQDRESVPSVSAAKGKLSSASHQRALRIYDKYMQLVVSEKKNLLQEISDFIAELQALT